MKKAMPSSTIPHRARLLSVCGELPFGNRKNGMIQEIQAIVSATKAGNGIG